LKEAFEIVLSQVLGQDCEIFIDQSTLNLGVEWREEIERLIKEPDGFIPIVTTSFFNSRMCIYELQIALELHRRILPIYFRTCSNGLRGSFKEDGQEAEIKIAMNTASRSLQRFQMKDFRDLRNDNYDSQLVQNFLDKMAEKLA